MMVMMTAMTPSEKASRRAGDEVNFDMGRRVGLFAASIQRREVGDCQDVVAMGDRIDLWLR